MLERDGAGAFGYQLHGGDDRARIQWYFRDRSRLPVAVHRWELPPGASEGGHAHPPSDPLDELYLVVAGTATMRVDAETHELGPGDAVLAPAGSDHDVRNTGTTPLTVVVVWGPPGAPVDWSGYGTYRAAQETDGGRRANGDAL